MIEGLEKIVDTFLLTPENTEFYLSPTGLFNGTRFREGV